MDDNSDKLRQDLTAARRRAEELAVRLFEDHHDFNSRIELLEKQLKEAKVVVDSAVRTQADFELSAKLVQGEITEREARYKLEIAAVETQLQKETELNKILRNEAAARVVALQNTQALYEEASKNLGAAANRFADERKVMEDYYLRQLEEAKLHEAELRDRLAVNEETIKVLRAEIATKTTALANAQALFNDTADQLGRAANVAATERQALESHFHREIEELKNHEAEMKDRIYHFEETIKILRQESNQKSVLIADLKDKASNMEKEMARRIKAYEKELEQLRNLMGERDAAAEALQRNADNATKQTHQARKERDDVRSVLGKEVDVLRDQVSQQETRVSELRTLLGERDAAAERLQRNADDATRATRDVRRELDQVRQTLGAEVDNKRAALTSATTEFEEKLKSLSTVEEQNKRLRREVADRDAKLAAMAKDAAHELAAAQKQLQAKSAEMHQVTAANSYLERVLLLVAIALPVSSWLDKKSRL